MELRSRHEVRRVIPRPVWGTERRSPHARAQDPQEEPGAPRTWVPILPHLPVASLAIFSSLRGGKTPPLRLPRGRAQPYSLDTGERQLPHTRPAPGSFRFVGHQESEPGGGSEWQGNFQIQGLGDGCSPQPGGQCPALVKSKSLFGSDDNQAQSISILRTPVSPLSEVS